MLDAMTKPARHRMNARQQMPKGIEVRYNEDGTVDEIVVTDRSGKCLLHMEQMSDSSYWLGLYGYGDDDAHHVDMTAEKGKIVARVRTC